MVGSASPSLAVSRRGTATPPGREAAAERARWFGVVRGLSLLSWLWPCSTRDVLDPPVARRQSRRSFRPSAWRATAAAAAAAALVTAQSCGLKPNEVVNMMLVTQYLDVLKVRRLSGLDQRSLVLYSTVRVALKVRRVQIESSVELFHHRHQIHVSAAEYRR